MTRSVGFVPSLTKRINIKVGGITPAIEVLMVALEGDLPLADTLISLDGVITTTDEEELLSLNRTKQFTCCDITAACIYHPHVLLVQVLLLWADHLKD